MSEENDGKVEIIDEPVTIDVVEVDSMDTYEDEIVVSTTTVAKVNFGADYRPPFEADPSVPIESVYTRFYAQDYDGPEAIASMYPDLDTNANSGYAIVLASMVVDFEVRESKTYKGIVSNIISYTDPEGNVRKAAPAKSKPKFDGGSLVGEAAVLAITSTLGYTPRIKIPMVNSGFTLEMRRPTGDDAMILDEMLLTAKGEFGRITVGSSMGFSSVYMQRDIVSTISRLILSHNLEFVPQDQGAELFKYIKSNDYFSLLVGYLAASNPDGLETNIPCMAKEGSCNNLVTGYTHPARLWNVDHGALTDGQLEHITKPYTEMVTREAYDAYQADFKHENDTFKFTRKGVVYKFKYKVPSIDEAIRAGTVWATNINKIVNRYITSKNDDIVRKRVVGSQINTNVLSQFGGWFESIELLNEEDNTRMGIVTDSDTIISLLKDLYTDREVGDTLDAIRGFIANSNPVTCGVRNTPCPSCQSNISSSDSYIIPIDMQNLFFIHSVDHQVLINHLDLMDIVA